MKKHKTVSLFQFTSFIGAHSPKMTTGFKWVVCFVFSCLFYACSQDYAPKPKGYFRIDLQEKTYLPIKNNLPFSFEIPANTTLIYKSDSISKNNWFDIYYPFYKARIYCSYITITPETFRQVAEDNYRLTYQHTIKADAIEEYSFSYPSRNVYGLFYELNGNVATPLQFIITDSLTHFFRGSLYFDSQSNQDSLRPVITYIKEDFIHIIETFEWK